MKHALIKLLSEKSDQDVTVAYGASWLCNDIVSKTGERISIQTIKRLTGVLNKNTDDTIHLNSISKNILAQYLGYRFWQDLEVRLKEITVLDARKKAINLYVDATLSHGAERIELLQLAADAGSAPAMAELADAFFHGVDVETNNETGLYWLTKAADHGHVLSAANLGGEYYHGDGSLVERDMVLAEKYLAIAAENDYLEAQACLILFYFTSGDYRNAIYWARLAAIENDPTALFILGRCFLEGLGVKKNVAEGLKWMQGAIDLGNPMAIRRMALEYYKGDIVPKNLNVAFSLLKKSASQGDGKGMAMLAKCYMNGWGTKQDKKKAEMLIKQVSESGDEDALEYLGVLLQSDQLK